MHLFKYEKETEDQGIGCKGRERKEKAKPSKAQWSSLHTELTGSPELALATEPDLL